MVVDLPRAMAQAGEMDLAHIVELEQSVWDALMAGDVAADRDRLAEDFVGVYPSGLVGREVHATQLAAGPTVSDVRLSETELRVIADSAALLVYRADYLRTGHETWDAMYISSLWCERDGHWLNVFSQDTPVDPEAFVP